MESPEDTYYRMFGRPMFMVPTGRKMSISRGKRRDCTNNHSQGQTKKARKQAKKSRRINRK